MSAALRPRQRVPPMAHLRRAQNRLRILNELMPPRALARTKKERQAAGNHPDAKDLRVYADALELVLRDHERILDGLTPDPAEGPGPYAQLEGGR